MHAAHIDVFFLLEIRLLRYKFDITGKANTSNKVFFFLLLFD